MAPESSFTSGGQEIQHIAFLHSQGGNHGEDALDEEASILAISADTALSPKDRGTDPSFSRVICRFNAGDPDEGE